MPKLKILSIGLELDGPSFESFGFEDAPSLSDYDAVVVDLQTVTEFVAAVIRGAKPLDRSELPIVSTGWPNSAGVVSISEFLERRHREANTLMDNGGVLICFAYPSVRFTINKGEWFIYNWLPSTSLRRYHPDNIVAGDGEVGRVETSHPFARFFSAFADQLQYKVFFNRKFAIDHPNIKIIAEARSGEPVAVEIYPYDTKSGRVIFVPPISEFDVSDRTKAAGVIQDCIVASIDVDTSESEPKWVKKYQMPGLAALNDAVATIEQQIQESELALAKAEEARDEVAHYKKLLWTTGTHQLEPVVREALSLFGFNVVKEGDRDAVLFFDGIKLAIAEVEGPTGAVDVDKYRQLLGYVQDEFVETGVLLKGILIGNGFRLLEPGTRKVQFTEKCIEGAEQQKYCLLDTNQLFEATKAILSDPSEELKSHIRHDILNTSGIYTFSCPASDPKTGPAAKKKP